MIEKFENPNEVGPEDDLAQGIPDFDAKPVTEISDPDAEDDGVIEDNYDETESDF